MFIRLVFILMLELLSGCTANILTIKKNHNIRDHGKYKVDTSFSSIAQNNRNYFLVLHYTALNDKDSFKVLTTGGKVSAHYLIPSIPLLDNDKLIIQQLVAENKQAWHAGISDWNNQNYINNASIGIEIVNLGYHSSPNGLLWYPFHHAQIDLVIQVSKDIIKRYNIKPINVLAHSDIAPLRKFDPGPLFPWKKIFEAGIGAWPDIKTVKKYLAGRNPKIITSISNIQIALAKYGYTIPQTGQLDNDTRKVIRAFQMHFRSENITGKPDAQTEAIALALIEKYK